MKRICYIVFLFCLFVAEAQPPVKFFTTFGGDGVDIGYSVKEIYNRQYIIAGSTTSYGAGSADAYLILADSMGQAVWQKTYGSVFADMARSVIFNPSDSGFVFTGYTASYGNGGYDVYVVRTDKIGNMLWQSAVGGLDWEFGNDLVFCSDGNIIVCGKTFSEGRGKSDGYVLKLNSTNGALIWKRTYGGSEDDGFVSIIATNEGNYTMAGNTKSYGDINNDFWLFKINTNGDSSLAVNLANPGKAEYCYDLIQDTQGNLVLCGSYDTSATNIGKNVSYIIKTDLNGNYLNEVRIKGAFTPDDKFVAICNSENGSQYLCARKVNHGSFGIDIQPVLFDYNYNVLNAVTYGELNEDETFDVIYTSDNGFVMLGYTKGFKSVSENIFFIKMDNSISNLANIVGLEERNAEEVNRIYYNDNRVYLKNKDSESTSYQIVDANGVIVQEGSVSSEQIELQENMPKGVYMAIIYGKNHLIKKFIRE